MLRNSRTRRYYKNAIGCRSRETIADLWSYHYDVGAQSSYVGAIKTQIFDYFAEDCRHATCWVDVSACLFNHLFDIFLLRRSIKVSRCILKVKKLVPDKHVYPPSNFDRCTFSQRRYGISCFMREKAAIITTHKLGYRVRGLIR